MGASIYDEEDFYDEPIPLGVDSDELRRAIAEIQYDTSTLDEFPPHDEEPDEQAFYAQVARRSQPVAAPYMQNRELSWLTFNERVLDQGADDNVPLLERLNFISIFSSNLQEFFMVRVGSLTDLSLIDPPLNDSKTLMTPKEQLRAIHKRCHELYPVQESTYEHVRGQLAGHGIRHFRPDDLSEEQRDYLYGLLKTNIEPFLSPQIINARHPFPHLENGKLYILVRLDDQADERERKKKDKDDKAKGKKGKGKKNKGADGVVLGLIPLPHQCDRIVKLPGRGFEFILLEHVIEMFVPEIFNMYKIKHTNVICVTRNADLDASQGGDELDDDYREHMKRLLRQRARLAPVRLECERPLSPVMEKLLLKKLDLKRHQVYVTTVPLDMSFSYALADMLPESMLERYSFEPFTPAWPTCFDKSKRILDQVTGRDTLMFYPYETMDPFVQLLREASVDPDVVSIKITLYRLAGQSHLAEALIHAAESGKEVTALFELRARFDENNNIEWSQRFEQAGCNVIYGFRDYKVHSKICCITRRLSNGNYQHITQLGTGNYNEKTAKLYTDLSFITTNDEFGRDAVEYFRNMQLENISDNYKVLSVAPLQIKQHILSHLDEQIALAHMNRPCGVFMKTNSITDKEIIEKLAEASQAGVQVTLFVRGISCILPHIMGETDNVRIVSLVGRLLEHSRIYCFGAGEECSIYLSSADLMTRNLDKRIEIAWPVFDRTLRKRILTYLDICMMDTAKLRELRSDGTYTPLGALRKIDEMGNPEPAYDSQEVLIAQAAAAARDAAALQKEGSSGMARPLEEQPVLVESTEVRAEEASRMLRSEAPQPSLHMHEASSDNLPADNSTDASEDDDMPADESLPSKQDGPIPGYEPQAADDDIIVPIAYAESANYSSDPSRLRQAYIAYPSPDDTNVVVPILPTDGPDALDVNERIEMLREQFTVPEEPVVIPTAVPPYDAVATARLVQPAKPYDELVDMSIEEILPAGAEERYDTPVNTAFGADPESDFLTRPNGQIVMPPDRKHPFGRKKK